MANEAHLAMLKQGVEAWNRWREQNPNVDPDLSNAELYGAALSGANLGGAVLTSAELIGADLRNAHLTGAFLTGANLMGAKLGGADLRAADISLAGLIGADLSGADLFFTDLNHAELGMADLRGASLKNANLSQANLLKADLSGADLNRANLVVAALFSTKLNNADLSEANCSGASIIEADLTGADLTRTDLSEAHLLRTNLSNANLTGCNVYGIAAWDLNLEGSTQLDLVITRRNQPAITVDNLEVAQFLYLLLNNEKIRHVIDTITSKTVLILGRFIKERKVVLDAIREELRHYDLLPVLFDFGVPSSRDIHETVTTLARMARFVIADITDPKSIPQELVSIVEQLPSLPVQPIIQKGQKPWAMYDHIKRYPWVLPLYKYADRDELLASLNDRVISPAESMADKLRLR